MEDDLVEREGEGKAMLCVTNCKPFFFASYRTAGHEFNVFISISSSEVAVSSLSQVFGLCCCICDFLYNPLRVFFCFFSLPYPRHFSCSVTSFTLSPDIAFLREKMHICVWHCSLCLHLSCLLLCLLCILSCMWLGQMTAGGVYVMAAPWKREFIVSLWQSPWQP